MQVSSTTNSYQTLNSYQQQRNTRQPEQPIAPTPPQTEASPSDVYKASNGNVVADRQGNLSLTSEGQVNVSNAQQAQTDATAADVQANRDDTRGNVVDYAAYQSKKSQVEIYLAVAADSKVEVPIDTTPIVLESLRQTQKENNVVQAYALYQENQKAATPALF